MKVNFAHSRKHAIFCDRIKMEVKQIFSYLNGASDGAETLRRLMNLGFRLINLENSEQIGAFLRSQS